ncbi:unnamed protein product [Malus baccata var. baccata]
MSPFSLPSKNKFGGKIIECLDRLAISLCGNTIVPVASEQLPAYLAAPEWQKHHAALIPLAQIAEGCAKAHAASAMLNFSENCTPDILTPYLDGVVSKLLVLLQNGKQMVQEGALTALASVADSSQDHFQKYYDAVMPYLKAILVNATDNKETITLGDKRIGIKISVLEEKATACNMLCCYADGLKEGFFPWIDQTSGPLLDESQVRSIVEEIKQVITASSSRKGERAERTKAETLMPEEQELIKEENEQEEEVVFVGARLRFGSVVGRQILVAFLVSLLILNGDNISVNSKTDVCLNHKSRILRALFGVTFFHQKAASI